MLRRKAIKFVILLCIVLQPIFLMAQSNDGKWFERNYKTLDSARAAGDRDAELKVLNQLIYGWSNDGNNTRSQELVARGYKLIDKAKSTEYVKDFFDALAVASSNSETRYGKREDAIKLGLKGLSYSTRQPSDDFWLYFGLGRSYWFKARSEIYFSEPYKSSYDSSYFYYRKALDVADSTVPKLSLVSLRIWMGRLSFFSEDKEDIKRSYSETAKFLKDTSEMNLTDKLMLLDMLYSAALRYNEMDSVLDLRRAINMYREQKNNFERQVMINDLDRKYELDVKNRELEIADQGLINRNKSIMILSLLFILTIILVFYFRQLLKKNQKLAKRNELLVREQNHRVKNNLQMISSLLSLQAGRTQDEISKEALRQSQGRIQSIALLNRSLYDQEEIGDVDLREYVQELITEVINSITDSEVKYKLDIGDIRLDLEKTTCLGLIINELIVNSVKYVKESVTEFRLRIKRDNNQFSFEYSDNGKDFSLDNYKASKSFGKRLIDLQTQQLKGKSTIKSNDGFEFALSFA